MYFFSFTFLVRGSVPDSYCLCLAAWRQPPLELESSVNIQIISPSYSVSVSEKTLQLFI